MKVVFITILTSFTLMCSAQNLITPGSNAIEKKWIRNQSYTVQWYVLRDTARIQMGEVTTKVERTKATVTIVTSVAMRNSKAQWTDSTVARSADLGPIRHASYNPQRNMVLNFGKTVTGFYEDRIKETRTAISDAPTGSFFDSNIYPMLITWLPLKEGLKQEIPIYDYNPMGKIGIIRAWVKNVVSGTCTTEKSGDIGVWIVSVADEISSEGTSVTYYIAKSDRTLWKQEISAAGRKMVMLRAE